MTTIDIENPEGAESISSAHKILRLPARFRVKSDKYGWQLTARTTLPFIFAVLVSGLLLPNNVLGWIIAIPLIGCSAYRIQFVLHDTCHMSLFSSRKLNDAVGSAVGTLIGVYFPRYRAIHFLHHKYNGLVEDPQLPDYLADQNISKAQYLKFLIEPLWGARLIPYLKRDLLEARVVKAKIPSAPKSWFASMVLTQLVVIFILTNGFTKIPFVLSMYVGFGTVSLFLARLRALAEHQQVGSQYTDFSRSHPKNWFDTILLQDANFCYHLEHHLYPSVQSRHLPELLDELTSELHTAESMGSSMLKTLKESYFKLN